MAERRLHLLTIAIVGVAALTLTGCGGDADTPDMQPPATSAPSAAHDDDHDDDADHDSDDATEDAKDAAEDAAEAADGAAACEVLSADRATAAMVFNPVIPEMTTVDELDARLALMDEVGAAPTTDLAEEWALWGEFLQTARDGSEASDLSWFPVADDIDDARDDLFEFYTENCF